MFGRMRRGSSCDLGSDCFTDRVFKVGARSLFDEMPVSDWRPPSRVLEVTIHQVRYPVTEKVRRQVFNRYVMLEEVQLFGGLVGVSARVVFESRHEAVEAYGSLHGRCIYDGCCQMDIRFGSWQEPDATMDSSVVDILSGTQEAPRQASATTTVAAKTSSDPDLSVVASSANDVVSSGVNVGALANCLTKCQGHATGAVALASMPRATPASSLSSVLLSNLESPMPFSTTSLVHSSPSAHLVFGEVPQSPRSIPDRYINIYESGNISAVAPASSMATRYIHELLRPCQCLRFLIGLCKEQADIYSQLLGGALTVHTPIHMFYIPHDTVIGSIDPGDEDLTVVLWLPPPKRVEQQPWPPPVHMMIVASNAKIRPASWPSFDITH